MKPLQISNHLAIIDSERRHLLPAVLFGAIRTVATTRTGSTIHYCCDSVSGSSLDPGTIATAINQANEEWDGRKQQRQQGSTALMWSGSQDREDTPKE